MASTGARTSPMTATQRLRVEACRASVLALHAAAGLASGPDADRQLLRVLRSAEALARTAVVLASSLPKTAAPAPAHSSPARPGGDASRAADDAVPCAAGARRRRRKSKKKEKVAENVAMVESVRQPGEVLQQPAPKPLDPGASAFVPSAGRVLKAQTSRERSPRRATPSPSPSNAAEAHIVASSHAPDDIVVISSLQSRPELANSRCRILGFDTDGGRYRVSLEGTGETIRVKPEALLPCLFPQGFSDAKGT
jgi:hypothetical protein